MKKTLQLLIVEDNPADAKLVLAELRATGFEPSWKRVETESDFLVEIKNSPDIILSDYSMPEFSGLRAAELLQASGLHIPFILISGTVGEDVAVEAMRHGATDYLLKDRIARLGSAVERALREAHGSRERKQADTELRWKTALLEAQVASSLDGILVVDPQGAKILQNQRMSDLWKIPPHIAEDKNDAAQIEFVTNRTKDPRKFADKVAFLYSHPDEVSRDEIELIDGTMLDRYSAPIRDPAGNHYGRIWTFRDITARKRAEERIADALNFNQAMLAASTTGILTYTTDGQCISANEAAARLVGATVEQLRAQNFNQLDSWKRAGCQAVAERVLQTGQEQELEVRFVTTFGKEVWLAARFTVFQFEGKPHLLALFTDIGERKTLEAQFRQSQKLENIGQLAGGIAHDFNNILAAIMMQVEITQMGENLPREAREDLTAILASAERAANLTRQLLLFSRKEVMQSHRLDLNEVVTSIAKMLQRLIREDVRLQLHLHSAPLLIFADPGMLDQVLMNLAVNARDAMPKGGTLIIETAGKIVTAGEADVNADALPGRYSCLSVSDTGCGMPPEIQSRIFEPFFTTKEAGKGTGLGLATVFGIVKQHKGWIKVHSEVGKGTTFQIFLPAIDVPADEALAKARATPKPRGGSETILVAEDNEPVRIVTRVVLERHGYHVLEAADGVAAQQVWAGHQGQIALLLTDMIMPGGVDGRELAALLQSQRPGLKVIFTSGYSADIAGRELKLKAGQSFVQKPCPPDQLLHAVRNSLDG